MLLSISLILRLLGKKRKPASVFSLPGDRGSFNGWEASGAAGGIATEDRRAEMNVVT